MKNETENQKSVEEEIEELDIYKLDLEEDEYFGAEITEYGEEKYKDHYLEQYKLFADKADKMSDKRAITNGFFLTLNTILGTTGIVLFDVLSNLLILIPIGVIGICFSILWFLLIRDYKKLNTAKYNVINKVEEKLPIKGYSAEWEILRKKKNYKGLTVFEMWIPWVVVFLYSVLIVCAIFFFFYN